MSRSFFALLTFCLALTAPASLLAQDMTGPVLVQISPAEVDRLLQDQEATLDRLQPLLAAIDTARAEAWLAQSPAELLAQRAGEEDEEQAIWQKAS